MNVMVIQLFQRIVPEEHTWIFITLGEQSLSILSCCLLITDFLKRK